MGVIYLDLFEEYKNKIYNGEYKSNDKLPSCRDMASIHGITRITANKVISELVNTRLAYSVKGVGTFVNFINNKDIAVLTHINVISANVGDWHKELVTNVTKYLIDLGYIPKIFMSLGRKNEELLSDTYLNDKNVAKSLSGAIFTLGSSNEEIFKEYNLPFIESCTAIQKNDTCVVLNYEKLAKLGMEILKEKNIKNYDVMYYYFGEDNGEYYSEKMLEIIDGITDDYNKFVRVDVSESDDRNACIRSTFINWWNSKDRADTLFVLEDAILNECLGIIKDLNIKIGKDLKIITHANSKTQFNSDVNFYRIAFDVEECAKKMVYLLDRKIKDPTYNKVIYIEPKVFTGDSLE